MEGRVRERLKRLRALYASESPLESAKVFSVSKRLKKDYVSKPPRARPRSVGATMTIDCETVHVVLLTMTIDVETVQVVHASMSVEYDTVTHSTSAPQMFRAFRTLEDLLDARRKQSTVDQVRESKLSLVARLYSCSDSRPFDGYCKWLCHFSDTYTCLFELMCSQRDDLTRDDCRLTMHRLRVFASKLGKLCASADLVATMPKVVGPKVLMAHFLNLCAGDMQRIWSFFAHRCKAFERNYDLDEMLEWVADMTFVAGELCALYELEPHRFQFWSNALSHMGEVKERTHADRSKVILGSPHFSPPRVPVAQLEL